MRLFDTHCHFDARDPAGIAAILSRARAAGVERLMAVGGSREMNEAARVAYGVQHGEGGAGEARRDLPAVVTAFGHDMDGVDWDRPTDDVGSIVRALDHPAVSPVAIGEIGLDYHYYGPETRQRQRTLFAAQLEAARRRDLPVVVHTREAAADTLALLREVPSRGVIHCFTGTPDEARAYLDLGFYVSISGIVTFRRADNVRASARYVPDDRILIETDAPFLAPVPMRGQANEPAFIRHTCEFLAGLRGVPAEDFAELTFANAERALDVAAAPSDGSSGPGPGAGLSGGRP